MSRSNTGERMPERHRDRVRRWLGIQNHDSKSAASNTATSTIAPALGPASSPRPSVNDSMLPSCIPAPDLVQTSMPVPEPDGDSGISSVITTPHLVQPQTPPPIINNSPLPTRAPTPDIIPDLQTETGPSNIGVKHLWAQALAYLSEQDKDTLKIDKTITKSYIGDLLKAAQEKRDVCIENRWEFELGGREINLRKKADKIITWLDKFKEVGDIIVQYDPSHAALPWAGVRFLLQMAVAERDQMEVLLVGVERVTNIVSRCRIYEVLFLDGNQSDETEDSIKPVFENLKAALIRLYTAVLKFLAKAYRAFGKGGISRARDGVFNPGLFEGLANELQDLDAEVVSAVGNCKEACNRNARKDMERLSKILEDLEEPVHRIDLGVKALLKSVGTSRRTQILQWISAIPYEDNHNTARAGHTGGTGAWLLQHSAYLEWRASYVCTVLWLHGIPGAGKTKLVSTVVDSLRRELENGLQGEALAYFYCDRNQTDRQSYEQIMRSFVRQLSTPWGGDTIPSCIDNSYTQKEKPGFASGSFTFQECCVLVPELLKSYKKVTLILDALDECDRSTRHHLINELNKLVNDSSSCIIKILISSRPDKDIKHRFHVVPNISIGATDNHDDIKKFITNSIDSSPPDWRDEVTSTPGLQEDIINTLQEKADGMFQWAKLQMDQLQSLSCAPDIRDFLGQLPEDLEKAYDEIMNRIEAQRGRAPQIAKRAFLWVMCSRKPLKPRDLIIAVCQDPETEATNIVDIDINFVLEACHNLLMIDQSGVCRFSHLSVQEYLETRRYSNSQAHTLAGTVCLRLLHDSGNQEDLRSLSSSRWGLEDENSVLMYAVAHWPNHVKQHAEGGIDDRLQLLLKGFLGSPNESSPMYVCWHLAYRKYYTYHDYHLSPSSVATFAVVRFGLIKILDGWLTSDLDVSLQNDIGESLLYIAAEGSSLSATTMLLDWGADVNAQGGRYGNALQAAALRGNKGGRYGNALQAAAWRGNEAIVHLLLDRGADVNAQGGEYGNALQAAALRGNEAIAHLLVDRGADVNAQGGGYGNALQAAALRGNKAIVHLLLDRGADVKAQGGYYGNALQTAASQGNEAIVHLLLDRGADINAQGGFYGNALKVAALRGNKAIVHLLLDRGADVNAQGGEYGNALQAAALRGNKAIVHLLLDRGADVNAQGGIYGNALQAAALGGSEAIVHLLLDRGADVNAQGGYYGNALQAATSEGNKAIVHLLLDRGADVNAQGGEYGNALQAATSKGNEAIVHLLLDHGAE
ncbi:hypothetical protein BDD12DRAFT_911128 [Trichophaea hybrida]|nr:hypothetical protein BDD12DRAFT_911128 [Trichophaea hybrida]